MVRASGPNLNEDAATAKLGGQLLVVAVTRHQDDRALANCRVPAGLLGNYIIAVATRGKDFKALLVPRPRVLLPKGPVAANRAGVCPSTAEFAAKPFDVEISLRARSARDLVEAPVEHVVEINDGCRFGESVVGDGIDGSGVTITLLGSKIRVHGVFLSVDGPCNFHALSHVIEAGRVCCTARPWGRAAGTCPVRGVELLKAATPDGRRCWRQFGAFSSYYLHTAIDLLRSLKIIHEVPNVVSDSSYDCPIHYFRYLSCIGSQTASECPDSLPKRVVPIAPFPSCLPFAGPSG